MKIPPQSQDHMPGVESALVPPAEHIRSTYKGSGKLVGKKALVTGGDSGIGRAAALHFAREGADVAIIYLEEEKDDGKDALKLIEAEGVQALGIATDLRSVENCNSAIAEIIGKFGTLDILVNNAGIQKVAKDLIDVSDDDWHWHFDINVHAMFYLTRAALKFLQKGSSIINTTSVNAFAGNDMLVAYSTTKAAQAGFTRALALQLAEKGIRVNEVAPGPIWTPIQPAGFGPIDPQIVADMGKSVPLGRIGQPSEVGPAYVYLASDDSSFITGQTIHVNGGMIVNG